MLTFLPTANPYLAFILRTFFVTIATVSLVIGLVESLSFFNGDILLDCFWDDSLKISKKNKNLLKQTIYLK
jgi:hypothetical protein